MAYDTASSCSFLEVMMAENPMISLVLYYFSADLKTTVFAEADGGPATWGGSLDLDLAARGYPEPLAAHRVSRPLVLCVFAGRGTP